VEELNGTPKIMGPDEILDLSGTREILGPAELEPALAKIDIDIGLP
jgi:hypothetical protein